jgi:tetratricopeptide (TPR) repeat protein
MSEERHKRHTPAAGRLVRAAVRCAIWLAVPAGVAGVAQATLPGGQRETWRDVLGVIESVEALPDSVSAVSDSWTEFGLGLQAELAGRSASALEHYDRARAAAPGDPEILVRRATCLLDLRRLGDAYEAAAAAVAADSTRIEALWVAGASLAAMGRLSEAVGPLRTMVEQIDDRRARDLLATLLERLGRYEEALEHVELLLSLNPLSPHQRERRAGLLTRLGRYEEALADYWIILDQTPEYPGLVEGMARLLRQLGRTDDLIRLYRTVVEQLPSRRDTHWKLIETLLQEGAWQEAQDRLKQLQASDPEDGLPVLQLGLLAFGRGEADSALARIEEAATLRIRPDLVYRWRMRIHFSQGASDSALFNARHLVNLEPESAEAWRILTLSQAELGRYEAALTSTGAWASVDEKDPEPLLLGSALCRQLDREEDGLSLMRGAVMRAPEETGVLLEYAALLESLDRVDEAAQVLKGILGRQPHHAESLNFLGYMWVDRGMQLAEAESLLEQALRLEPGNPAFLDSMGWLWYKKGDLARAERWLERAISSGGRHPEIFRHLAQVKMERGKRGEARQVLELGLEQNPSESTLDEFLRSLDEER